MENTVPLTFRTMDEKIGIYLGKLIPEGWPLEIWFANIYDVSIDQFPVEDLAKSCRQHQATRNYLDPLMPLCIAVLQKEPLAGEMYDGELLTSLMKLPAEYWQGRSEQQQKLVSIATVAFDQASYDVHFLNDIIRFVISSPSSR